MSKKISYEDFFKKAILKLRNLAKSQGIHSVYSGFNDAFRQYYSDDPIKITQQLAQEGKIEIRPVKGGVMIYLPGEAPKSRSHLGKQALAAILDEPEPKDKNLIERVLSEIGPSNIKVFPDDFVSCYKDKDSIFVIEVPGTSLQLEVNSDIIIVSPRRHFQYKAKNPPEAKYVLYAHRIGHRKIRIPHNNQLVFKAVRAYEKYCQAMKHNCFAQFLEHTNDEEMAEYLTRETVKRLDLRAM